jgi:hypothetical protein
MCLTGQFVVAMKRVIIFFCALGAFACIREPEPADLVKHMVVQTNYSVDDVNDTENVFTTYSKFLLRRDTIGYVFPQGDPSDTILVDGLNNMSDYVTPVVNLVETHVTNAGFTRTTSIDDADFAVNIVVLQNFSFFQSVSYPGYYSGYYNYYGYYSPIVTNYYSNYATMVIEVVDVKNFVENGGYKVIWKANIGDLLTTVDLRGKTLEAVDQAFVQSPYFSKD